MRSLLALPGRCRIVQAQRAEARRQQDENEGPDP